MLEGRPAEFAVLSAEERGFVAAMALLDGGALGDGIDPAAARRCAAAWGLLRPLDRPARAAALALLLREPTLEHLHPTWIEEALSAEPSDLVRALGAGLPPNVAAAAESLVQRRGEAQVAARPIGEEPLADLRRLVLGPLSRLCAAPAGPIAERLVGMSPRERLEELATLGARTLGLSLAGAPAEARARAMAAVGDPWAEEIARASSAPAADRDEARRHATAASSFPSGDPLDRLRAIGVLAVRSGLEEEGRGSLAAVAGRLPVSLGRLLLP